MDKMPEIEENIVESVEDVEENLEEEPLPSIPEIKEKEKVSQEEIFGNKKQSANKDIAAEIKKVKKPKREISDAQRERLRLGREKALANRRAKAQAKKESKEKKVKFNDTFTPGADEFIDEFKETATSTKPKNNIEKNHKEISPPQITKDEILEMTAKASQKALEEYEIVRKERKKNKKIKQEENNHRIKVRQTIEQAVKGPQRDTSFDFCFM